MEMIVSGQDISICQALSQLGDSFYRPSRVGAALKQKSPPRFLGAGHFKSVNVFTSRRPLLLPSALQPALRA
jgi:hypothetical protein